MRAVQLLYTALAVVAVSSTGLPQSVGNVPEIARCVERRVIAPGSFETLGFAPVQFLCVRPGREQYPVHLALAGSCCSSSLRPAPPMLGPAMRPNPQRARQNGKPLSRHCVLQLCLASTGTASSESTKGLRQKPRDLSDISVETLHAQLETLLDEQWQRASVDYGIEPPASSANATWNKVKHVVGGFSVVVRMPDEGLAYRMQPMRSLKAGLTWVAFYMMLQEVTLDRQAGAEAAAADVLFRPDRSVVLGSSKFRTSSPRKMAWEHLDVAKEFQSSRLRKATKRLVYFRHQLLKTSTAAFKQGECTSAQNCDISSSDGGYLAGPCVSNGLMFPSHWFWIKVGDPADIPGVDSESYAQDYDAAVSHEGHVAPGTPKRMKGAELASALLFRAKKVAPATQRRAPLLSRGSNSTLPRGTAPAAVSVAPVNVLASVFPHAQGDVGGLCKRLWMAGATDNVTILVVQSILRGLRRLHSVVRENVRARSVRER